MAASRIAALVLVSLISREAVVREADLVADVVQGADGVLEGDLARLESADAVQGRVPDRDGSLDGGTDAVSGYLELRDGDNTVKLSRAPFELAQKACLVRRLRHRGERGRQRGQ